MTIYHDYIAPWFDRFIQLPEGPLRASIEKLATSIEFPLTKILVVEGSKRSAHSNAYFFGFFKNKRIVLFDTLLKESPFEKEKVEAERKKKEQLVKESAEKTEFSSEQETKDSDAEKEKERIELENESEMGGEEVKRDEDEEKKSGKGCSDEEILAVLGHELGHWKMNHTLKHLFIGQVSIHLL